MTAYLIRGGRLICPQTGRDSQGDIEIRDAMINVVTSEPGSIPVTDQTVVDATGAIISPGFVDLHAHVGEPGHEYKEDIASASAAAAAGGFTSVCVSAISVPVNDTRAITEFIRRRGDEVDGARMCPIAALTVGADGKRLTEMFDLRDGGAVAFGDGERGHCDAGLMRRAMEYARAVGVPVFESPRDPHLAGVGVMHEGPVATLLGLKGIPVAAEEMAVARAVALARQTGAPIHIGPISAAVSVAALRGAKADGLPVTCSVLASHLHLIDADIRTAWSPNLHLEPPLRSESDRRALCAGLADGTIDAVASGHRPQSGVEKDVPFARALPGMIGFQTALPLLLKLVESGELSLHRAVESLPWGPERCLRRTGGGVAVGQAADLVMFDLDSTYVLSETRLLSRSRNTPFLGRQFNGALRGTWVGGQPVFTGYVKDKEADK